MATTQRNARGARPDAAAAPRGRARRSAPAASAEKLQPLGRRRSTASPRRRRRRCRTPRPTPAASSPTPPTRWRSPATATRSRRSRPGSAPRPTRSRRATRCPTTTILHPGEVLLLPDGVPRPAAGLDSGAVTSQPLGWTPDQASAAIDSAGGGTAPPHGQPVPERPERAADRPGAPPGRGRRDRLLDRPALRRLGDGARLVERPRPRPRGPRRTRSS